MNDTTIICRCEDVTLGDIRAALDEGITNFEELKRILRCTMGSCQGRTCRELILREVAAARGIAPDEVEIPVFRPPTAPVTLGELAAAHRRREGGEADE